MTRVLHLGKFYPPDNGGIESVTASLARAAVAAGFDTSVLCFASNGHGESCDCGVTIHRVSGMKIASQPLSWNYLRQAVQLARQADIVHVHLPNMLAALAVMRLGPGPKVVLHWHSDVIGKKPISYLTQSLEYGALKRADKVICTSPVYAAASRALRHFKQKIAVIPLGVPDVAATKMTAEQLFELLPPKLHAQIKNRPLILAVGRLVPYKGFSVLIDAAMTMVKDAAIVIVGCGPLESELRNQIKATGSGERLILAGRVDETTLNALFSHASIFCMPSVERSEAFGVAIIEAMTHGLPIVATNIPGSGVPWVNQHNESGLNVTPYSAKELANALDTLLQDDPLRLRLSQGARKRYIEHFTENISTAATLNLYTRL